jgi:hypothetical protein
MAKISHDCKKVHPKMTHYEWAKEQKISPGSFRDLLSRPTDLKKDKEYMKKVKSKNPFSPFKSGGKIKDFRGNRQFD